MTRKQHAKEATRKQLIWFAVALATNLTLFAWHESGLALYFMSGISTVHLFLAEQYHTGKMDPPKWVKEEDEKRRWELINNRKWRKTSDLTNQSH